jgi:hypothetical protein
MDEYLVLLAVNIWRESIEKWQIINLHHVNTYIYFHKEERKKREKKKKESF